MGVLGVDHVAFRTPDAVRLRSFRVCDPDGRPVEIVHDDGNDDTVFRQED
jgi:hypothetical protein